MNLQKTNSHWHYDTLSRYLHWILAPFIIGMMSVGWYMMSIADSPDSRVYFTLHKSFGIITGILILLRVIWRVKHQPAPLPATIALWQAKLAKLMHLLLYICIILMPITGFLGASYGEYGVTFFGWHIPDWVTKNPDLSKLFFDIHGIVVWVLVALISLHVLAAFKHLLIDKDGVFQRMWQ